MNTDVLAASEQANQRVDPTTLPLTAHPSLALAAAVRDLIDHAAHTSGDWVVLDESLVMLDIEVEGVRCTLRRPLPSGERQEGLSPREREIADMLAGGLSNKAIAKALDISTFTVASHLRRIFVKLGVANRAGVVGMLASPRAHLRSGSVL